MCGYICSDLTCCYIGKISQVLIQCLTREKPIHRAASPAPQNLMMRRKDQRYNVFVDPQWGNSVFHSSSIKHTDMYKNIQKMYIIQKNIHINIASAKSNDSKINRSFIYLLLEQQAFRTNTPIKWWIPPLIQFPLSGSS